MPETQFVKNDVTVKVGANLQFQGQTLERFQVKAAAGVVNKAISCLRSAHRQLQAGARGNVLKYASRYFMVGPQGPNAEQRNVMLSVLVLTLNGLDSERTVVVDEHGMNPDALGWTNVASVPADQLANLQTTSPERRTYYDTGSKSYVSAGEINVSNGLLDAEQKQAVTTFIHEATHRYANTQDFGEKGYSNNGVVFNQPGLTTMEALANAESYGWFAYKVGR